MHNEQRGREVAPGDSLNCSLKVVNREMEKTLVIEDDVRFEHQFKKKLIKLMDDIEKAQLDWELM